METNWLAIVYVPLTKCQVLEAWWFESVGLTSGGPWFCKPFGGLTRESYNLSFGHRALACIPLTLGGIHWRHGDMLLHICHLLWVTHTGVMMVIRSCMYVTCHGFHTLVT